MTDTTPTTPTPPEGLTDAELWDLFCRFCREDFGNKFMTFDKFCEGARAAIAADRAARPAPTPEELEAQFRAWWADVAFGQHLLGRGVQ